MPKINLIVEVLDKKQSYIAHGKYNTDTRIVEIQRGFRKTVSTKFLIDPEHIFRLISGNRISLKAYVDNASRKSVSMKTLPKQKVIKQLKQERQQTIEQLETQMQTAATEQKYEEAIKLRNKIDSLKNSPEPKPEQPEQLPGSINPSRTQTTKEIDGKQKNTLDYLIEEVFWKSIIAKNKIPLSTILIMFMAGGGIFFLIRDLILPLFGVHA